jgi:hypothetical protein
VEPQAAPLCDLREHVERIDRSGAHGSRGADDAERLVPGAEVVLDHRLERVDTHAKRVVDGHLAHVVAADGQQRRRLGDRVVRLGRDVEPHRARQRLRTRPPDVDRRLHASRRRERREVRHRAAADEDPVRPCVRPDHVTDPFHGDALDLDRPWSRAPDGEVGVEHRGQQVGEARDRDAGRLHVSEHARMAVVPGEGHQAFLELNQRRGEAHPLLG